MEHDAAAPRLGRAVRDEWLLDWRWLHVNPRLVWCRTVLDVQQEWRLRMDAPAFTRNAVPHVRSRRERGWPKRWCRAQQVLAALKNWPRHPGGGPASIVLQISWSDIWFLRSCLSWTGCTTARWIPACAGTAIMLVWCLSGARYQRKPLPLDGSLDGGGLGGSGDAAV